MIRSVAELGLGLAPARPARAIRPGERIHVVGIAGAGASAAALHAAAQGAVVTGCDAGGPSPYSVAVEAVGIRIAWSHHASHVTDGPRPDRLAVTKALTAVAPDHPELRAAASRGIPAEPWQQVIADAAFGRTLLAIAGTHGKSTTAGWLTWLLAEVGADPGAFVGALLPASLSGGIPATARLGRGPLFVVEADEYAGNFDAYRPDLVGLTTIEWDHPDVFADRAAVARAIAGWLARVPAATIVANLDDPGVVDLLGSLETDAAAHGPLVGVSVAGRLRAGEATATPSTIGLDARISATILERTPDETVLEVTDLGPSPLSARLRVTGDHNASNALVALGTAAAVLATGGAPATGAPTSSGAPGSGAAVSPDRLLWALATFPGVGRRLERKGEANGVAVYDDYGHHPTAIRATLAALRQREPGRPIWAVYEPLTFHRTAAMLGEFADALAEADAVAVADIWAGRDLDVAITSPEALAASVRARRPGIRAMAPGTVEQTAAWLVDRMVDGDVVLVMGGGRSYRIAELLLEALENRASS